MESPLDPANFEFSMEQLFLRGWISKWGVRDGDIFVDWTPKGLERRRWIRTMATELQCSPRAWEIINALCCAVDHPGEDPVPPLTPEGPLS